MYIMSASLVAALQGGKKDLLARRTSMAYGANRQGETG
jgi:hypothetical protein